MSGTEDPMPLQHYCLRWNDHLINFTSVFTNLFRSEALVDCTIAAEGRQLQAHKIVLSACSPFFQDVFSANPDKHPIVILKDITFDDLTTVIHFVYFGEVNVSKDRLQGIIKTAETLQIKGLVELPSHLSSIKRGRFVSHSMSASLTSQGSFAEHRLSREYSEAAPPDRKSVSPEPTSSSEKDSKPPFMRGRLASSDTALKSPKSSIDSQHESNTSGSNPSLLSISSLPTLKADSFEGSPDTDMTKNDPRTSLESDDPVPAPRAPSQNEDRTPLKELPACLTVQSSISSTAGSSFDSDSLPANSSFDGVSRNKRPRILKRQECVKKEVDEPLPPPTVDCPTTGVPQNQETWSGLPRSKIQKLLPKLENLLPVTTPKTPEVVQPVPAFSQVPVFQPGPEQFVRILDPGNTQILGGGEQAYYIIQNHQQNEKPVFIQSDNPQVQIQGCLPSATLSKAQLRTKIEETIRQASETIEASPLRRLERDPNKKEETARPFQPARSWNSSRIPSKTELSSSGNAHCPVQRDGPALGCVFCWNSVESGTQKILRRKTKYCCPQCQVNLCIVPCFQIFHDNLGHSDSYDQLSTDLKKAVG